jgi:hypothetical protein
MDRRVSQPGLDVSTEIKRMLGIGQGTLADKERDYQARAAVKAPVPPKPQFELTQISGIWFVVSADGGLRGMRHATKDEIKQYAPVTILDNDDD